MKKHFFAWVFLVTGISLIALSAKTDENSSNSVTLGHVRTAAQQLGLSPEDASKLVQSTVNARDDEERACKAQGCEWNVNKCNWQKCGD